MKTFATCLFFLSALILLSCAVRKATINTFTDPAYTPGQIQKIAMFPARNARLSPGDAQQIVRKISQALQTKNPQIQIISAAESIRRLNDAGLVDDWDYFLDGYLSSSIPDVPALQEIGQALKVDAILYGELVNIFQQDGAFGANKGTTRVTVNFSLLDTRKGKLVWEATSDGVCITSTTVESAPPAINAINLAVDKILATLPQF